MKARIEIDQEPKESREGDRYLREEKEQGIEYNQQGRPIHESDNTIRDQECKRHLHQKGVGWKGREALQKQKGLTWGRRTIKNVCRR